MTHDHKIQQVQKAHYGKSETKRAITNVLGNVLHKYKYGSLAELNAVLKGYNIVADRGNKDSRIFKNNGLHYRILNDRGEKGGVPIKASALYNNPGMKFLGKRFVENQSLKQAHKSRTSNAIDIYFIKNPTPSLSGLNMALQKEGIQLVTRGNDQSVIYGLTYIDHQTKCVYNGSQLGKISTTLAIQDASQLKLNYGRELADVITNICGNIIVGQANGEIAKQVSERLGKTLQQRESISINSSDTSISKSKQLDYAVPLSTISSLSSGEFVGMVSHNPEQIIDLNTFHARIKNDHDALAKQKATFVALPVIKKVDKSFVSNNYYLIKEQIQDLVDIILNDIINDPAKEHFIVKKH